MKSRFCRNLFLFYINLVFVPRLRFYIRTSIKNNTLPQPGQVKLRLSSCKTKETFARLLEEQENIWNKVTLTYADV